jgi:hypothetical protein
MRPAMKYLAALFLFLVLLGRIAGIMHFAFVRHATCADHDELVHLSEAAEPSTGQSNNRELGLENVATPNAHHHDHCLAQLRLRDAAVLDARSAASLEGVALAVASPRFASAPPLALSVLHIAPKTSPPIQS